MNTKFEKNLEFHEKHKLRMNPKFYHNTKFPWKPKL
jgi:hypothetical protein